jgi:hypothetical protein
LVELLITPYLPAITRSIDKGEKSPFSTVAAKAFFSAKFYQ